MRDDSDEKSGLSGTASAFSKGWDAAGSKGGKKSPKGKKGSGSSPDVDSSAQGGKKSILSYIPHFKKGGPVKKTGLALLHRGEYVVPAKHRSTKKGSRKRTVTKI